METLNQNVCLLIRYQWGLKYAYHKLDKKNDKEIIELWNTKGIVPSQYIPKVEYWTANGIIARQNDGKKFMEIFNGLLYDPDKKITLNNLQFAKNMGKDNNFDVSFIKTPKEMRFVCSKGHYTNGFLSYFKDNEEFISSVS